MTEPTESNTTAPTGVGDELVWGSLLPIVRAALLRPRLVLGSALFFPVAAVALAFLGGPEYTARSSFTPEATEGNVSQFAGLAQQFGINIGGSGPVGDPVRFYEELLLSWDLLEQVALTEYSIAVEGRQDSLRGNYLDLYEIRGRTAGETLRRAVDRLRGEVTPGATRDAGIVRLETKARWPQLAVQLNKRLLELVSDFNLDRRQSQAAAQRRFVEGSLKEARTESQRAEDDLRDFLQRNRLYQDSPELTFEAARLQRVLDLRQQVHTQLAQAYEQARIDEVRNTPVITIIERPDGSVRDTGGWVFDAVVWLVVGLALGISLAVALESYQRHRLEDPETYDEIRGLRRTMLRRLIMSGGKRPDSRRVDNLVS